MLFNEFVIMESIFLELKSPFRTWVLLVCGTLALVIVRFLCLVVSRLYLSPLASFPGPKIAAATFLYESWYDLVKKGTYYKEIERMHRDYGPIVRVTPDELSIRDASFYDSVYVHGHKRRTEVMHSSFRGSGLEGTFLASQDHDLHRRRRKPIEPYFSRNGILKLQGFITDHVARLMERFDHLQGSGRVVRLDYALNACTGDVISHMCIDEPGSLLDNYNFAEEWSETLQNIVLSAHLVNTFRGLNHILRYIPKMVITHFAPETQHIQALRELARGHIETAKREKQECDVEDSLPLEGKPTLFRYLVHESTLEKDDLSTDRLLQEAMIILGIGTHSVSRPALISIFQLLEHPEMRQRLQKELEGIMAGWPEKRPELQELEKLPYLQAIINESLRVGNISLHKLIRVSPDVPLQYKQWTIPAGTPVGMSLYFQHTDPDVFPNPFEFCPERWLSDVTPEMKRSFVPFSRGSRRCPASSLALAELNFLLAAMFGPHGPKFELFEADWSDLEAVHDYFLPLPRFDSKGLRIIFN